MRWFLNLNLILPIRYRDKFLERSNRCSWSKASFIFGKLSKLLINLFHLILQKRIKVVSEVLKLGDIISRSYFSHLFFKGLQFFSVLQDESVILQWTNFALVHCFSDPG